MDSLESDSIKGKALIIDFLNSDGTVYITSDKKNLAGLCSSATMIYNRNSSQSSVEKNDVAKVSKSKGEKKLERKKLRTSHPINY